ncbi:hypothetical protein PIB30_041470 [Stylosanthes scabra]|uniref:Aminotransferase-like plant mobile domain-containing protein n=1 Tax=Stylosanthes scabra TaxID=79078 RepID=A0ABU6QEJ3_9FABA|nr:hypothetical protein [Stylosanthes scabra]
MPPPACLVPYIHEAGFGGPLQMRPFDYDMPLVSALVERWRPETHSFHLPWGSARSPCSYSMYARYGLSSRTAHRRRTDQRVRAGLPGVVWDRHLGDGPAISGRTSPGWRGKNYAGVKMTWLRQGALFPDKTKNIVLLRRDNMEMNDFLPLVLSWIYQRFPRFCPPSRSVMVFPLVSRLNGLAQTSRDTHARRQLEFQNELDRVGVDDVRIPELVRCSLRVLI